MRSDHCRPSAGSSPPPPPCDRGQLVEVTPPPPPRQPLRHGHARTDTDGAHSPARPCPPPPLPCREPLAPRNASPVVEAQARPAPPGPAALDSVVPLVCWPLRTLDKPPSAHHVALDDCARPSRTHHSTLQSAAVSGMALSPTSSLPAVNRRTTSTPPAVVAMAKTLSAGRGNVYVDSPTLNRGGGVGVGGGAVPQQHAPAGITERPETNSGRGGSLLRPPSSNQQHSSSSPTVKFNPVVQTNGGGPTAGAEKGHGGVVVAGQPRSADAARVCRGGIVCQRCGRCRCANCTAPRELPKRWIGDQECSVQRCVRVSSCLCLVEGLFYHCLDGNYVDDASGGGAGDDPCACCERPRCCLRWTLMAALAGTVLPCLCCYCPLQCAAEAVTTCYNACAAPRGCRCRGTATHEASSGSSQRGLLAESESSST